MWGDWPELVQSVLIGVVFSFLVAKLIPIVLAFREDGLQIVREADIRFDPDSSDLPETRSRSEVEAPAKDDDKLKLAGDEAAIDEKKAVLDGGSEEEEEDDDDDDWEGVESTELDEAFSAATAFVAIAAADRLSQKVSSDVQLQLYGLYKIATEGPCTTPQPSALKMSARAKWNAWQRLGAMPPEEAMQKYIAVVTELYPTWASGSTSKRKEGETETSTTAKGTMGPVFSSLVYEEESENDLKMDAIHAFAREGEKHNILKCIENGISLNVRDSEGRTPLHWAVDRGQTDIVELLINKSADVNAQDNEGQTPLHYAVVCDREAIADLLMKHYADCDIKDNDGCSSKDLCESGWLCMHSACSN